MSAARCVAFTCVILAVMVGRDSAMGDEAKVNDVSSGTPVVFQVNADKPLSSRPISPLMIAFPGFMVFDQAGQ